MTGNALPEGTPHERLDQQEKQDVATGNGVSSSPPEMPAPAPPQDFSFGRLLTVTLVLANASFMNTAIAQICVIELPQISHDLAIPLGRQPWVITTNSLAASCSLLLFGRLADLLGRRLIFCIGAVGIAISCLVAPFAPHEIPFFVFRGIQGLSSAACLPTAVGIIFSSYPTAKGRLYAISTFSAGFPLGNVIGSVLGGIVGQYLSWKWAFWIVAIETSIMAALALLVIPHDRRIARLQLGNYLSALRGLDWSGLAMITAALICLLVALSEGNVVGWKTSWVLALLCASCILFLPAFLIWEHLLARRGQHDKMLVKLALFENGTYAAAQVVCFIFWACFNIFLVFATYLYQDYQGLTEIQTTLRFLPSGITGVLAVFASSQIVARIDGYWLTIFGILAVAAASLLFAIPIPPDTTYWAYGFPGMIIVTLGADTLYPCLTLLVMRSVPHEDQASGAAIFQTIGQIGRSLGLAIATAISITVSHQTGTRTATSSSSAAATLEGYRAANWFSFAFGLSAALVTIIMFRGCGKLAKLD